MESERQQKSKRLEAFDNIDLYPVTCEKRSNERSDIDVLKEIIEGGAKIIQLRDKISSKRVIYEKAVKFREICTDAGILLIMNDHIDIAIAVNADGIHLGQDDFPIEEAVKLLPDKIIGASTHTLREALLAEEAGADYINIGPIFPTTTKEGIDKFLGPDIIVNICTNIKVPFTVMGGINRKNIDVVLGKGATKIAMVSSITAMSSVKNAVKEIRGKIVATKNQ
jgi:thiamine-phosphate pyrophosphorylase